MNFRVGDKIKYKYGQIYPGEYIIMEMNDKIELVHIKFTDINGFEQNFSQTYNELIRDWRKINTPNNFKFYKYIPLNQDN